MHTLEMKITGRPILHLLYDDIKYAEKQDLMFCVPDTTSARALVTYLTTFECYRKEQQSSNPIRGGIRRAFDSFRPDSKSYTVEQPEVDWHLALEHIILKHPTRPTIRIKAIVTSKPDLPWDMVGCFS